MKILCIKHDREAATASSLAGDLRYRGLEVRVAQDGREGFMTILSWAPDFVLCGIGSGIDLLEHLATVAPRFGRVPVVLLVAAADAGRRGGAACRADDDVATPVDFDALTATIVGRLARVGRSDISPQSDALKESEISVLTWAARGHTSAKIAELLGLSKRTVDFHIDNARTKLGATTRVEAVTKALSGRLIEP
jgi:DNA-binding NarL/FixJ family response regulator